MPVSRLASATMACWRLVAALSLVCAVGCSSKLVDKLVEKLPEQPQVATSRASTTVRKATKSGGVRSLPHGSTCVCPTIVTGTSHGCWEAL